MSYDEFDLTTSYDAQHATEYTVNAMINDAGTVRYTTNDPTRPSVDYIKLLDSLGVSNDATVTRVKFELRSAGFKIPTPQRLNYIVKQRQSRVLTQKLNEIADRIEGLSEHIDGIANRLGIET